MMKIKEVYLEIKFKSWKEKKWNLLWLVHLEVIYIKCKVVMYGYLLLDIEKSIIIIVPLTCLLSLVKLYCHSSDIWLVCLITWPSKQVGFCTIKKIWPILKHFTKSFHQAKLLIFEEFYYLRVLFYFLSFSIAKST